jgi:hypothetical protein
MLIAEKQRAQDCKERFYKLAAIATKRRLAASMSS